MDSPFVDVVVDGFLDASLAVAAAATTNEKSWISPHRFQLQHRSDGGVGVRGPGAAVIAAQDGELQLEESLRGLASPLWIVLVLVLHEAEVAAIDDENVGAEQRWN